jgi:hypothetical protein
VMSDIGRKEPPSHILAQSFEERVPDFPFRSGSRCQSGHRIKYAKVDAEAASVRRPAIGFRARPAWLFIRDKKRGQVAEHPGADDGVAPDGGGEEAGGQAAAQVGLIRETPRHHDTLSDFSSAACYSRCHDAAATGRRHLRSKQQGTLPLLARS